MDVALLHVQRPLGQALPGSQLIVGQTVNQGVVALQPLDKTNLAGVRRLVLLSLQHGQDLRVFMGQQAERQHPARSDGQAMAAEDPDLAVAAQANRIDLDRFDHRAPVTNHGAVKAEGRLAATHYGNVGGGATHVSHDGVTQAAQRAGAEQTGSGARQHRAHRALQRRRHVDQRAIALDHHQGGRHRMHRQGLLDRINQRLDVGNHPRVQGHGQSTTRRAQARCQLMAAGDGLVTQFFNPGAQLLLMGRVAHCKTGRDGKRADARRMAQDGRFGRRLIQRNSRMAPRVMATGQRHYGIGTHQLKQPAGFDLGRLIAGQQDTDRRALAFNDRIGREGGGQRHQHHLCQPVFGQPIQ